jgi:hypothetical protein
MAIGSIHWVSSSCKLCAASSCVSQARSVFREFEKAAFRNERHERGASGGAAAVRAHGVAVRSRLGTRCRTGHCQFLRAAKGLLRFRNSSLQGCLCLLLVVGDLWGEKKAIAHLMLDGERTIQGGKYSSHIQNTQLTSLSIRVLCWKRDSSC